MTFEASKQAIAALLERIPVQPLPQGEILSQVNLADTASELAGVVAKTFPQLFKAYGHELTQTLSATLTPALWQSQGVLLHPSSIPADGPEAYWVIAGTTPIAQEVDKTVTYLGDVTATISAGTAHIMDSKKEVEAMGHAKVYAYGTSQVNGYDESEVFYRDRSRGLAKDLAIVHANDRSYIVVSGGAVTLYAHDMAQYQVIDGRTTVIADGSSRGLVAPIPQFNDCIRVHLSEQCLLFTQKEAHQAIKVETENFSGTILSWDSKPIDTVKLLDVCVPRFKEPSPKETGLVRPLDFKVLLNDLKAFIDRHMPTLETSLIYRSHDERTLCAHMLPLLPQLIANGMTGEFLRTHFSEQTLEEHLIHAFSRPEAVRTNRHAPGTHYFFGNQLVHASRYGGNVVCYEKALLIADKKRDLLKVDGQAIGITMGTVPLEVKGEGGAITLDYSHITAGDQAHAYAYGESFVTATGHAYVEAHQSAGVEADDHCKVYMTGEASAQLTGYVKAMVQDTNDVVADEHVIVGYREIHPGRKDVVKALAPTVQVHKLNTEKAREQFSALWLDENRAERLDSRRKPKL